MITPFRKMIVMFLLIAIALATSSCSDSENEPADIEIGQIDAFPKGCYDGFILSVEKKYDGNALLCLIKITDEPQFNEWMVPHSGDTLSISSTEDSRFIQGFREGETIRFTISHCISFGNHIHFWYCDSLKLCK